MGTVVVCLLAGLLMGTARASSQDRDVRTRAVDLSVLVSEAEQRVQNADAAAGRLQAGIDAEADADLSPTVEKVLAQARALQPAAGLTAVAGPALQVTLTDAPRDSDGNYPAGVDPDDLVVHQQDVQAVVNALWAGGAEAMTIMGQRVITTSAVRCIGNTLLLQGRTYSPPFVVAAIGDGTRMRTALDGEPGVTLFRKYVDRFDLGYEVVALDDVTMPAYDGLVRAQSATTMPR
ncbi:uncharacterized protein YlxW (UPF0749 family) [Nakamurella flavida]|nr:DUF881 domain-containing protein [Nakamurella flavida]MDP9778546.1 uncharacterized protein YlxW (UPF0749 family) [Nakamurella flavida]